ncbi:MAG: alpha/beta hydrolase [Hyphomicrobiaceae bacterium]
MSAGYRPQPDPATRLVLAAVAATKPPPTHTLTPAEARAAMLNAGKVADMAPPAVARVGDRTIPGPGGGKLKVRIYDPREANGPSLPVLAYFHGGGFVIGDLDTHDTICRALCRASGAIVMAVDYRLAPEHRYPAAVDDACAAVAWLEANAAEIGGDPSRLAVGGDSAGATLAAVAAQDARARGTSALKAQLLFYPVTDIGGDYPSREEQKATPPIPRETLSWFWEQYFGPGAGEDVRLDPRASPIRATSLAGLPPTFLLTAGLDPLRDEGLAYASRLAADNVETCYVSATGTIHGFLRMGKLIPATHDALAAAGAFLARRVGLA